MIDEDCEEDNIHTDCPKCGRYLDEIDYEYQSCSKCGYDIEKGQFDRKLRREPTEGDYMAGDADIITGRWH